MGQIYYVLCLTANKDKAIYRELLATWDATALHRRVAIEFRIFKDAKTRARLYDDEDEQFSNAEPWRNPYSNVLDDLFEDLDDENTESLKAAIRMRCGGADSDYSTSSMQPYSSSLPGPGLIGGSTLKGNNPVQYWVSLILSFFLQLY